MFEKKRGRERKNKSYMVYDRGIRIVERKLCERMKKNDETI